MSSPLQNPDGQNRPEEKFPQEAIREVLLSMLADLASLEFRVKLGMACILINALATIYLVVR